MDSSTQSEMQALADAYVLDVLSAEERQRFNELIAGGDTAAVAALDEARGLAGLLAQEAEAVEPPAALRERALASSAPAPVAEREPPVVEFRAPAQEPRTKPRTPAWMWVAAAALVVGIGVSWFARQTAEAQLAEAMERLGEMRAAQEALIEENGRYERMLTILSAAETRAVSLAAPENARIHVYWNDDQGLLLAGTGMPVPPGDRTLQLWAIPREGNPISVDIFRPDAGGEAVAMFAAPLAIREAVALAITEEAAGGAPQPTMTPIWVGNVG